MPIKLFMPPCLLKACGLSFGIQWSGIITKYNFFQVFYPPRTVYGSRLLKKQEIAVRDDATWGKDAISKLLKMQIYLTKSNLYGKKSAGGWPPADFVCGLTNWLSLGLFMAYKPPMAISARRFKARPCGDELLALGLVSPYQLTTILLGSILWFFSR